MMLIPPPGEQSRLDAHFVRTLRQLHSSSPPRLGAAQTRARARHLERLDVYRQRGVFPKNRRFLGRALPHFIDESGTRCAMAHLIEATDGAPKDLVQYVARERNFARIHALADISELVLWLEANGLTLEEAAMIQPEYCGSPAENCVCQSVSYQGLVRGTADTATTHMTVDAIHGPVTGVALGDVLALATNVDVPIEANDIVFAAVYTTGTDGGLGASPKFKATSTSSVVVIHENVCSFPQVASIPGPVPYDVLTQALSASSVGACEQVLAEHDPDWKAEQGGIDCLGGTGGTGATGGGGATGGSGGTEATGTPSDGGCNVSASGGLGPTAIVVLSTALVLQLSRRRQRAP